MQIYQFFIIKDGIYQNYKVNIKAQMELLVI